MAEIGGGTISSLLKTMYEDWYQSKIRHRERFKAGLGELEEVKGLYGPGYMAGQERTALAGATQAFAGRGLGGTTRPTAVSAGMKAQFEDVRRQGRAGAMTNIANYMAGFKEEEATPGVLAHLATGGFSGALQERGMNLQTAVARAPGEPLASTYGQYDPNYMESLFGSALGMRQSVGKETTTMPSLSMPGSPYGDMGGAADIKMAPATGQTYYGAAAQTGGGAETAGADLSSIYQSWAAEMKRRYPNKPVMPQSRWERLVYPKMGESVSRFGG